MWELVPRPGIEPGPRALGVQSFSHWTTREVPSVWALNSLVMAPSLDVILTTGCWGSPSSCRLDTADIFCQLPPHLLALWC